MLVFLYLQQYSSGDRAHGLAWFGKEKDMASRINNTSII